MMMRKSKKWTAVACCVTTLFACVACAAPPPPSHPPSNGGGKQQPGAGKSGCPGEFIVKYKHASEVCQKETAAVFKYAESEDDTNALGAVFAQSTGGRFRRNKEKSSDKVDSEIVLCTYQKLKQLPNFTQIANLEKECTSDDSTNASSEEEDAETGLANCLMEKLEAMCPALAAAA